MSNVLQFTVYFADTLTSTFSHCWSIGAVSASRLVKSPDSHVRAWVEVVGSVMEFISFQSSMKCEKNFCVKSGKLAVRG